MYIKSPKNKVFHKVDSDWRDPAKHPSTTIPRDPGSPKLRMVSWNLNAFLRR